jgi:hypothetical protein
MCLPTMFCDLLLTTYPYLHMSEDHPTIYTLAAMNLLQSHLGYQLSMGGESVHIQLPPHLQHPQGPTNSPTVTPD